MKPPYDERPPGAARERSGRGSRPAGGGPSRPQSASTGQHLDKRAGKGPGDRPAFDAKAQNGARPALQLRESRRPPPDRTGGPRPRQPGERVAKQPAAPSAKPLHTADASRATPSPDRREQRSREPASLETQGPARPRLIARPQPVPANPDAPQGTLWIYGIHAVAAALANPARRLRRLLLTEEAQPAITARLPQPWPVAPEPTDRARLEQLLGRNIVHQGAALLADPLASPPLQAVLQRPGPILVLDQVSDPRNIGAILRSAAAFGVAAVITQDRNSPEETGALAKAASGALETVPLLRAVNIARTLVALRTAGCWVIGLDASGATLSGAALAGRRVALVLGNEGDGLRRLTRETCDELAGIAMPGGGLMMESLNVSAAAAVALYEMARAG